MQMTLLTDQCNLPSTRGLSWSNLLKDTSDSDFRLGSVRYRDLCGLLGGAVSRAHLGDLFERVGRGWRPGEELESKEAAILTVGK